MAETSKLVRIPSLKTVSDFRRQIESLGIELPSDDHLIGAPESPLAKSVGLAVNGKVIGNRIAVQPMEGWDGTTTGGITDDVRRRWRRFGESGAKLICGGEAMAVRADGRANPNQLIINAGNEKDLSELVRIVTGAHEELYGKSDELVIGFQLTHSGRFCKPEDHSRLQPRVAYRHPLLDKRFSVTSDQCVWTDSEIEQLIQAYAAAAKVAWNAGADFVDIKHCHGYLLHEFLSAFTRPGKYGGSFENRTRILREIVSAIRASNNRIDLGVRLSAFDFVPYRPDPALTQPGKPGPGIPEDYSQLLPYQYAFGTNQDCPTKPDLKEAFQFAGLCVELGVKVLSVTAGSPYYNPHIQRPAAYPPSDGYQPPEDPLVGVARQIHAVRQIREHLAARGGRGSASENHSGLEGKHGACPLVVVGSAYSYLQEYLPHVAQFVVREGWTDCVGVGRMALSYPSLLSDVLANRPLNTKAICRTFSDCTTAPRNGLVSGCYPLDKYYANKGEAQKLKAIKKPSSG